jgi:predicted nucleic acid-binding protein
MRISLPDVNILIALHDPKHVGHDKAHEWFNMEGQQGWATCPVASLPVFVIVVVGGTGGTSSPSDSCRKIACLLHC